ncbi:MAG: hypothetical protein EZS28_018962 [Streblomastix strix]|uniref:Uncharacterized protein n=1 Tax=Streblomastix strix TaxID=222440 RepID=A0A5J4VSG9_9EUKA|nr:MAG: hypothetical protein EZS28_018962 [Streblomastix strix]
MQEKAANGEYENEEKIVMDLTRLLVYYEDETEEIYAIKGYDSICDKQVLYHKLEGIVYKQLEKININFKIKKTEEKTDDKNESKQLTSKHIIKKYASKFAKKRCKLISEDSKILTVFQGYKYKKLKTIDYKCLQMYLELIKETIAASNKRVYKYILNWFAWMIQNPGRKSRAAIVLYDRQCIGKNRFNRVIAELTSKYRCPNITNIDVITERFNSVVENKIIDEKNQPRRVAENVMNIIHVTNVDMPVQLDTDDRLHLVYACKTVHQVTEVHKEDANYFNEFSSSYTQEFYENLMTFFLERDISKFNPILIPMTEAKKYLTNVSRSHVDDVIMEYYEQIKQGIPIAIENQFKPSNWLLKTYKNAMVHKCEEQTPRINGLRTRVYVLNKDQQSYYDDMMNEEDTETSNANYQKYKKTVEDDGFIEQVVQGTKDE